MGWIISSKIFVNDNHIIIFSVSTKLLPLLMILSDVFHLVSSTDFFWGTYYHMIIFPVSSMQLLLSMIETDVTLRLSHTFFSPGTVIAP